MVTRKEQLGWKGFRDTDFIKRAVAAGISRTNILGISKQRKREVFGTDSSKTIRSLIGKSGGTQYTETGSRRDRGEIASARKAAERRKFGVAQDPQSIRLAQKQAALKAAKDLRAKFLKANKKKTAQRIKTYADSIKKVGLEKASRRQATFKLLLVNPPTTLIPLGIFFSGCNELFNIDA